MKDIRAIDAQLTQLKSSLPSNPDGLKSTLKATEKMTAQLKVNC